MIYDLSHTIANDMTYFPGDPEPRLSPWPLDTPWHVLEMHLGSHCGTHLDAPLHIGRGSGVEALPLGRLIGRGVVIDVSDKQPGERIVPGDILAAEGVLRQGIWPILRTGWSRHWGTPAYFAHPSLDPELARLLVAWKVDLVGMDLLNPDDTASSASIVHEILLGAGTLIVENLAGLDQLTPAPSTPLPSCLSSWQTATAHRCVRWRGMKGRQHRTDPRLRACVDSATPHMLRFGHEARSHARTMPATHDRVLKDADDGTAASAPRHDLPGRACHRVLLLLV